MGWQKGKLGVEFEYECRWQSWAHYHSLIVSQVRSLHASARWDETWEYWIIYGSFPHSSFQNKTKAKKERNAVALFQKPKWKIIQLMVWPIPDFALICKMDKMDYGQMVQFENANLRRGAWPASFFFIFIIHLCKNFFKILSIPPHEHAAVITKMRLEEWNVTGSDGKCHFRVCNFCDFSWYHWHARRNKSLFNYKPALQTSLASNPST